MAKEMQERCGCNDICFKKYTLLLVLQNADPPLIFFQ